LKKRMLIRGKWLSAAVGVITSVLASILLVAVSTVVVVVTSAGFLLAAMRRESQRRRTPQDWQPIAGRQRF
jgi:hypothetical protein